jgi:hypothetical protein
MYSFAGALTLFSKLILCLVMIRRRHRGPPVAIDRTIIIPSEFRQRNAGSETPAGGTAPTRTSTGELRENQGIDSGKVYSQGITGDFKLDKGADFSPPRWQSEGPEL